MFSHLSAFSSNNAFISTRLTTYGRREGNCTNLNQFKKKSLENRILHLPPFRKTTTITTRCILNYARKISVSTGSTVEAKFIVP